MFNKRSLIVALVGLNLALAAALLLSLELLPAAQAAGRGGRPGDFALCTAQVRSDLDVVYIIDQQDRKLHCFVPAKSNDGKMAYVQTRDLEADIRRTQ